jgi:hypothetical protein
MPNVFILNVFLPNDIATNVVVPFNFSKFLGQASCIRSNRVSLERNAQARETLKQLTNFLGSFLEQRCVIKTVVTVIIHVSFR